MSRRIALLAAVRRAVARTPARRLLDSELVRKARLRAGREVTAGRAREVADALERAGVDHWLIGGWGVDALAGRQTRPHVDLDIVVDAADPTARERATAALAPIGLAPAGEETSIPPLAVVWVYADGHGTVVDLLPADLAAPPFDNAGARTAGTLGGRPVGCVSASVQRTLRTGYRHRRADRDDLAVLDRLPGG